MQSTKTIPAKLSNNGTLTKIRLVDRFEMVNVTQSGSSNYKTLPNNFITKQRSTKCNTLKPFLKYYITVQVPSKSIR